jgi:hypothetical protein
MASIPIKMTLPASANWFSLSSIHQYERDALPEFFSDADHLRTPQTYKDYRDFMLHAYWQNPSQYLTYTACRRNLVGDACSILRVHQFLDQRGLINFQVTSSTVPTAIPSVSVMPRPTTSSMVQQHKQQQEEAANKAKTVNGWTEEETLRLLGAIEQYGDDWVRVANALGNRTAHECVLHFIRLPPQ